MTGIKMSNVDNALKYAANGMAVFPCDADKRPLVKDWLTSASVDAQTIRKWWQAHPDALIGLPLKPLDLLVIDADRHVVDEDGVALLRELVAKHGPLPPHPWCTTPRDGEHHFFRQSANGAKIGLKKIGKGLEVRGARAENDGGYMIASGSELPDGRRWWRGNGSPSLIESYRDGTIPELPAQLITIIRPPDPPSPSPAAKSQQAANGGSREAAYARTALDNLCAELAAMPRESGRNIALNNAALQMGHMIAAGWIERAEVEDHLFAAATACGLVRDTGKHAVNATIKSGLEAGLHEPRAPLEDRPLPSRGQKRQDAKRKEKANADEADSSVTPDDAAPEFTEEALALAFAAQHARDLRFVALWSRWYRWNGKHWAPDDTLFAFDLARKVSRYFAEQPKAPATRLTSAKTVAATVTLARADRRLAATAGQWDADPWLLNTPSGILDLRTGELRPAHPTDYMIRITAAAPSGDCPLWQQFLQRVTGSNVELIAYLQRLVGYALTGSTQEHVMAFLYGLGANGKSVFIATISGILGDYHRTTPIETFTASNVDRHPTELADLRGARMVTSVETEEGRRWAESRIKTLTGGDRIAARFMRQDFFEYIPQFKLLIAGNHKPGLRSVDEAIRRRFHLVPFSITIPPAERDKHLTEKLRAEWPGILQWAVKGCLDWQRTGLVPPKAVTEATAAYLESEDAIVAWMDECGRRDPNAWHSRTELYASWVLWADKNGEYVISRKRFLESLETRGLMPNRRRDGSRGFHGLRLTSQYSETYTEQQSG
jgi:putative DNA primase/helicase